MQATVVPRLPTVLQSHLPCVWNCHSSLAYYASKTGYSQATHTSSNDSTSKVRAASLRASQTVPKRNDISLINRSHQTSSSVVLICLARLALPQSATILHSTVALQDYSTPGDRPICSRRLSAHSRLLGARLYSISSRKTGQAQLLHRRHDQRQKSMAATPHASEQAS